MSGASLTQSLHQVIRIPRSARESATIYARHLTTIEDALRVWLDQHDTEEIWNEQNERFETRSETHVLYWTWLDDGDTVLIISCFTRED